MCRFCMRHAQVLPCVRIPVTPSMICHQSYQEVSSVNLSQLGSVAVTLEASVLGTHEAPVWGDYKGLWW